MEDMRLRSEEAAHKEKDVTSLKQHRAIYKVANHIPSTIPPPFDTQTWKKLNPRDQSSLRQDLRTLLEDHIKL